MKNGWFSQSVKHDDSCNNDSSICLGFRSMFAKRIQSTKMVLDVLNVRQEHFRRRQADDTNLIRDVNSKSVVSKMIRVTYIL